MRLRDTTPRKHVHVWKLTKHLEPLYSWSRAIRLERECIGCGAVQNAMIGDSHPNLPPPALRALTDTEWFPGRLLD